MAQKEKFFMISESDHQWRLKQTAAVRLLFDVAAMACPFGDRWEKFEIDLAPSTFRAARRKLEEAKIFKFKPYYSPTDQRVVEGWETLYLHGSRAEREIDAPEIADNSGNRQPQLLEKIDAREIAPIATGMAGIDSELADKLCGILDTSGFDSFSDFNQTESENLIICEQNPKVSSFDESLCSTHMAGYEEEKCSVLMKDLEVLQHPLSTDQDLGSHSSTNSSSTKTTTSTEPSCSSSEKKRFVSTSDDGSVELIRLRSPHGKTPQNTSCPNQNVRKLTAAPSSLTAPQAPWTPTNAQSHRNPTQSSLKAQLGGSQLESAIEELEESLQAVADDLEMTVEGGIDELCRRFAGLATETEVELLPVPREYPYYNRMNEWVLYENKSIVCFVQRGPETRRLTIGCFR